MMKSVRRLSLPMLVCLSLSAVTTDPSPIPASATEVRPLLVGSVVPADVLVQRLDGTASTVEAELKGKPTVLIFYRGGWCPFCSKHLSALGSAVGELQAAGWNLLALAPDQPAVMRAAKDKNADGVERVSDATGAAMRAFGVAYHVDDATMSKLRGYKIDLAAAAGNDHRLLPVPSVFLIAADGTVRFVHVDPDYKQRLDPQVILAAARAVLAQK